MTNREITLDGNSIHTADEFHDLLSQKLNFGPCYGKNLSALWDRLSTDVERPVKIIWINSGQSKACLGDYFDKIIEIFEETKQQDLRFNWDEKFDYVLK